jgi:hypothetical protein
MAVISHFGGPGKKGPMWLVRLGSSLPNPLVIPGLTPTPVGVHTLWREARNLAPNLTTSKGSCS